MKKNLKLLGNWILLKPNPSSEKVTKTGLIVNDSLSRFSELEIVAVGDGEFQNATKIPIELSVGQTAIIRTDNLEKVRIDGEDYWIVNKHSIIGIF